MYYLMNKIPFLSNSWLLAFIFSQNNTAPFYYFPEMGLTADQVFDEIGSFGRFQLYILILFNILEWFWFGWPVLLMTFIAAEPKWKCVSNHGNNFNGNSSFNASITINSSLNVNSSNITTPLCPLTKPVGPGHDDYDYRCKIPRDLWEFEDTFTSVVTQVNRYVQQHNEMHVVHHFVFQNYRSSVPITLHLR